MNLLSVNNKSMNILSNLKSAIANLAELADEKASIEQRRAKAKAEIAAAGQEKMTPQIEAKVCHASNVIAVCDARLAHLESSSKAEADAIHGIYMETRAKWNKLCAVRRELARDSFLTACMPFFDNNEKLTAERLDGILTLPMARLGRAGANSMPRPDASPFALLQHVQGFLGFVERQAEKNSIPID